MSLIDRLQNQAGLLDDSLQDIKDKPAEGRLNAEYHFVQTIKLGIEFFGEDALKGFVLVQTKPKECAGKKLDNRAGVL